MCDYSGIIRNNIEGMTDDEKLIYYLSLSLAFLIIVELYYMEFYTYE